MKATPSIAAASLELLRREAVDFDRDSVLRALLLHVKTVTDLAATGRCDKDEDVDRLQHLFDVGG